MSCARETLWLFCGLPYHGRLQPCLNHHWTWFCRLLHGVLVVKIQTMPDASTYPREGRYVCKVLLFSCINCDDAKNDSSYAVVTNNACPFFRSSYDYKTSKHS
ncbi:hypothetical protein RvY_16124-2 [Ramazzottius varieornatus]|uniref:Uncharacterized protein n=1 Tax=Ramazzottius varieornatus TaxID=947166 RepID=A0A1D1VYC2_RAMVA|nr:hypothetical protein RvY_16124-2 [Ramazzottius varieornatus]